MERVQISKLVVLTLLDYHKMSSKELAKHLNASRGSIHTAIYQARKKGLVEHAGYSRYTLTEKGKQVAGLLLQGKSYIIASREVGAVPTPPTIPDGSEGSPSKQTTEVLPPARSGDGAPVNWQREYIKLALTIAGRSPKE